MASRKRPLDEDRNAWERQSWEHSGAWARFVAYRDAGPTRGAMPQTTMAVANRWMDRSIAYDRHMDRLRVEADAEAIRKMRKRHTDLAATLVTLGASEIVKFVRQSQAQPDRPVLSMREALDATDRGMRLERLNRGEAETVTETRTKRSVADLVASDLDDGEGDDD
jgi:hypothetical protein